MKQKSWDSETFVLFLGLSLHPPEGKPGPPCSPAQSHFKREDNMSLFLDT